MHKFLCSSCLQRSIVVVSSLSTRRVSCTHTRLLSQWFAVHEPSVEVPFSELPPSSSSFSREAPIGLINPSSTGLRRSLGSLGVPTFVDDSELGGSDIVDEDVHENILGMQAVNQSLYELDILATDDESNADLHNNDGSPSRDLPGSTLPLRGSSHRKTPRNTHDKGRIERSSRCQGVRSRLIHSLSSSSVAAASTAAATITIPRIESTSESVETEPEASPVVREGEREREEGRIRGEGKKEMDQEKLMDILEKSDMVGLRSLLDTSFWPKNRLSPSQLSRIFTLVIDEGRDCEECRKMMRDFACASPRHCLPSHIPLLMAARSAREEGVQRAIEALQFHHKAFIMAPISLRSHESLRVAATRSLWMEVAKRSEEADATEVYECGVRMGLMEGTGELVEEILKEKMRRGASFSSLFRDWVAMGERYGSRHHGMSTLVRAAITQKGAIRMNSLASISSFVASSSSLRMESFIVHLVLNLLWMGEEKAAKHVFSLVSIHGRYWREILVEMERDQTSHDLVLVEKIADLITYGVIGELRKTEKKMKVENAVVKESAKELEERREVKDDLSEMMEMIVWKANGGKNDWRRNKHKKVKKRVKIDQKEMHELVERIQKTWLHLETKLNGPSSEGMLRLAKWSILHRLALPESISHLISSSPMKIR